MPDQNIGTAFSGGAQQGMEICDPVLERSRLRYRVAAARLKVLFTFTYRENSPGTVVGAYPVGFSDRRQHCLLGWVERFAPCFGAVASPETNTTVGDPLPWHSR